jgi:Zn-dependent protease
MRWSLEIARIAGVRVRLHITFLLLIAWLFSGYYQRGGTAFAASQVLFIIVLFTCVVLHEFGHALAAQGFGIRTFDIMLLPIGGVARLERMPEKPIQELIVALAGPAVNVAIALGLYAVIGLRASLDPVELGGQDLLSKIFAVNIGLTLFNLLPAFPMDGGRVLRALLGMRLGFLRSTQIAAAIGKVFAVIFGFVGYFYWGNPMLLFIAVFIFIAGSQEVAVAKLRAVPPEIPVAAVFPPR